MLGGGLLCGPWLRGWHRGWVGGSCWYLQCVGWEMGGSGLAWVAAGCGQGAHGMMASGDAAGDYVGAWYSMQLVWAFSGGRALMW